MSQKLLRDQTGIQKYHLYVKSYSTILC